MEITSESPEAEAERSSMVHLGGRPRRPPKWPIEDRSASASGDSDRPLGGTAPATALPDPAFESGGHFRLAHSSGGSLPVGCGGIGKGSQVGGGLLPRA